MEPQYAQYLIATSARNCDILVSEKDLIIIAQLIYTSTGLSKKSSRVSKRLR
jgi:hypothetical protein